LVQTAIFINLVALACLAFALSRDRSKILKSLTISAKTFLRIFPMVVIIILVIGLLQAFIPNESIGRFIGQQGGFFGIIITALVGSILFIPSIISFPLAGSLLDSGASVSSIAAFVTTLTMVGIITLPLEIREMGRKMALLRNGLSFIIALAIALIMGLILT
jgi:uncharacterized membrane protein YraQ (UPF0718 family)